LPVLATFSYNINPGFVVERSLIWGFALGWWDMAIINPAQPAIVQEVPFGGYRVTLKFHDWFWENDGGAGGITDILEDLYATPPGGGAPIAVGTCIVNYQWDETFKKPLLVYALSPSDNHFFINRFPFMPNNYWSEPDSPSPPVPVIIDA
jgi:hypothetical protein